MMFVQKPIERLSDIIPKNDFTEGLENILGDVSLLIDEGYFMEVYINPKGISYVNPEDIFKGNVDNGCHLYRYIDKECTYGELLDIFDRGSIRDETMTIMVIPCFEDFFQMERTKSIPISIELDTLRGYIA